MASQLQRVTRGRGMRQDQIAQLNARLRLLPQMQAAKERNEAIEMNKAQFNKQYSLQKRGLEAQKRAQEATMGLEAAKLGMTAATSDVGAKTIGGAIGKIPGLGSAGTSGGFLNNITVGSALGGGLAGFGAARLAGGKSKTKRAMYGMGAGALMGFLGSKAGSGLAGAGTGAVTGLLGGLL